MFSTPPPRKMVQTRGAKEKEKQMQEQTAKEGPSGLSVSDVRSEGVVASSVKLESGCHKSKSTPSKKISMASRKSFEVRKKQLELEAAEAIAKLQKEVIEKKLAADIAALEENCSQKSRDSCNQSSVNASQKVEQWLDSHVDAKEASHRPHTSEKQNGGTNIILPTYSQNIPPPTEFQELAQALKDIAVAASSNTPNNRMLSRLCTPRDLPIFNGDSMEWLSFKQAYEESTEVCQFTPKENMWRLRKCLKGAAREAVTALLVSASSPEAVMSTLHLQFGQPDIILPRIMQDIKRLHSVNLEYHKDIVTFSVKIKNYVAAVMALGQEEYLRGTSTTSLILSKLPPVLISKWTDYGYSRIDKGIKSRLELLSDFLSEEALKISKTSVTLSSVRSDFKRKYSENDHTLLIKSNQGESNFIKSDEKCRFCRIYKHNLPDCKKFKKALRRDRWQYVKRGGLCYKCLVSRHNKESCPAPVCDQDNCGQSHHRLLHYKTTTDNSQSGGGVSITQLPDPEPNIEAVTNVNCTSKVLLKIIPINIYYPKGVMRVFAMLDDGSTVSLISAQLTKRLGLYGKKQTMRVCGAWNNTALVCDSEIVQLSISNGEGNMFTISARSVNELNLPVQNMSSIDPARYKHLAEIKDKFIKGHCKPDILIGQDNYNLLLPIRVIKGKSNEPYATLTPLGWCIHGCVSNLPHDCVYHSSLLVCSEPENNEIILREIQEDVRRSFTLESMGITTKPRENSEDVQAVSHLEKTSALVNGRWLVGLPWKNVNSKMPTSLPNAMARLKNVEKKMKINEGFAVRYAERVRHLFENDFAQEVSAPGTSPRTWYLPHFGVDNPNKKKLRLVFDAAAKSHGVCLNDYLLKGPDLLMSLYGIMLRFRENKIAVIADIKDQFLRIKIIPEDQDALRFIWRDNTNNPVKIFAMTSLIFGANCSPFIAQFIKNKNSLRFMSDKPAAVHAICKQHYADDYIDSLEDESTATQLVKDIIYIHSLGGFEIRNWTSNCAAVLDFLPKEFLGSSTVRFKMDQQEEGERTLGLIWFPKDDCLGFDVSFKKIPESIINGTKKPTKREMLRVVMSIFDVYGFLSPFTIKGKIMLQDTWKCDVNWDDVIPEIIYNKWIEWLQILQRIGSLRLPRYYQMATRQKETKYALNALDSSETPSPRASPPASHVPPVEPSPSFNKTTADLRTIIAARYTNLQLHIFCDASTKAMCAVAYWRWEHNGIRTAFISSKCRVAPLKNMSVPRLELQAALLAARLANTIQKEHNMKPEKKIFWCDSSTVLNWISNNARNYKIFIAHRLGEIDELTSISEWRYVPSKLNVADLATRETCDFSVFENEWFYGPSYLLSDESSWPKNCQAPVVKKEDLECTLIFQSQTNKENLPVVPDPLRFSSWLRLVKSTCMVFSFIDKKCRKLTGDINGDMMLRAERLLLRYAQALSFPDEIKNLKQKNGLEKGNKLLTLSPIIDEHGVMRVGGRIDAVHGVPDDTKHPVILDGRTHITRLIVSHFHIRAAHGNHETVVNELKQKYWILRIRPTVKRVAMDCMVCKIRKAQPRPPRMGDLPEARMAHHQRPFTYCGLDLFGPMDVAIGRRREKRYAVLYTCLTVRAIHIEIVTSLTSDSLIMSLRRMAARRGWPLYLYSDNGTNLRGADNELRKAIQNLNQDNLKSGAINYGTTWTFIPPSSPHWGGAWERLIRTVKTSLKVVLKERVPREEVLLTLLVEVEQIVNGRPLTHVSVEPGTEEALTPNHFLLGSSSNLPILGEFNDDDFYMRKQWRISQRLADKYWSRWVKEVLPLLIPRKKWTSEEKQLQVGDLVVVVDPNAPRNTWIRGIIDGVFPGRDKRVRVVDVRTRTGVMRRSATRVARIPVELEC